MTPEEFNAQLQSENFKRSRKCNPMGHAEIADRINTAFSQDEAARIRCWELVQGYPEPTGQTEAQLVWMSQTCFDIVDEIIAEERSAKV